MNFVPSKIMSGGARRVYPFAAILAQEEMKLALLLNAVNPAIGGVVVRGQKGTAKSTAARGLRDLLPRCPTAGVRRSWISPWARPRTW